MWVANEAGKEHVGVEWAGVLVPDTTGKHKSFDMDRPNGGDGGRELYLAKCLCLCGLSDSRCCSNSRNPIQSPRRCCLSWPFTGKVEAEAAAAAVTGFDVES